MYFTSDPVADADRYNDAQDKMDTAREAAREEFEAEITRIFTCDIRKVPAKSLTVPVVRGNCVERAPLADSITDTVSYGSPTEAFMAVLEKSDCPLVKTLRETLAADYADRWAMDCAEASL